MKYLIFGRGYLGHKFLEALGDEAMITSADIASISEVQAAVEEYKPDVIINTAGKTGKPNIDWCEDHKAETVYSNVTGPLILSKVASDKGIKMVHLGSGCIYYGDTKKEFSEADVPNIESVISFYSKTKAWSEQILSHFPILQVRLRMPVDSDPNPRNLIWKITHYEKVMDQVPNSVSIIPDLIDTTIKLIEKEKTGIYNVVNPGSITHGEILKLYKELVNPDHAYESITEEELSKLTKATRSNCILSTQKLENEGIILPDIYNRIKEILKEYKANLSAN